MMEELANSTTTSVQIRQDLKNMEYFSDQIDTYDDHVNDIKPTNPFSKPKQ